VVPPRSLVARGDGVGLETQVVVGGESEGVRSSMWRKTAHETTGGVAGGRRCGAWDGGD
jgi:hypothetical protein